MNLKQHTILPPSIRCQEKWKFCIWHCPIIVESNRTVPNSTKITIFIAILLGTYSSNGIGGTPLQIISGSSLQEDVLFPVLIDNLGSFACKCMCSFYCTWRTGINNLKKQKNNTTFVNLIGAFICFILCNVNLSSEFCFDNMVLGLLSVNRPGF